MLNARLMRYKVAACFIYLCLCSCYHPPYNGFKSTNKIGNPVTGIGKRLFNSNNSQMINDLQRVDIQVETYGETITMIIPTDRYFILNTPKLNETCYAGLMLMANFIKQYPNCTIYVAGFTDDVGSRQHKNALSQAQAETIVSFLWANGVQAYRISGEGYGDKYSISDNQIIHGSAQNRRVEVQCFNERATQQRVIMPLGPTK